MTQTFNVRFNKSSKVGRWLVEDAATLHQLLVEHVIIQTPSHTISNDAGTLFSIQTTGVLVCEDGTATIK